MRLLDRARPATEHAEIASPRARAIVAIAVVCGAVLIAATLRVPRDSDGFYAAGFGLAAVWVLAALGAGGVRTPVDRVNLASDLLIGVALGALTFAVFLGGDEIGRRISFLAGPIHNILAKADAGALAAVLTLALVNAVAEEVFFRGVLMDALPDHIAPMVSVVVYVGVTAVGGNTALTVAALVMGAVFVAERVITRSLLAPIVTHIVWSTLVILLLPR